MSKFEKNWVHEGDPVAHTTNCHMKMTVRRILFRNKSYEDPHDKKKEIRKKILRGIECEWFEGETFRKEMFHSKSLVPWDIALLGEAAVCEYVNNRKTAWEE